MFPQLFTHFIEQIQPLHIFTFFLPYNIEKGRLFDYQHYRIDPLYFTLFLLMDTIHSYERILQSNYFKRLLVL